jgi:DNA-binding transcriptional LysR family regulator
MNLLHIKYAVEVAEAGSINKAAKNLYVGQPNLSRAIKDLENSLGVTIFDRSAKGMVLTSDGEVFIRYAKNILNQVDSIEELFSQGSLNKKRFSVSVPRASYIADAFANFSKSLDRNTEVEVFYKETNSMRTIKNVLQDDYKLGIIRYAENYDKYYKSMMDEKELEYEMITDFRYVLLMNEKSPLAYKPEITYDDLKDYIEIAHGDPYVPTLPFVEVKKEELPDNSHRRIYVFERASQFELLAQNPETFMWVSHIPESLLNRYNLLQRICNDNTRIYKDVLIHKKEYSLSNLDGIFISELCNSKREIFK